MSKPGSVEALQARLLAIPVEVKEALKPALAKSGEELQATMQHLAPVDTGALRESIKVTLPGETTPAYSQPGGARTAGETEVLVTAGDVEVRYPHLVEYGTEDAPAQPYFWPSFRSRRKRIENRLKRVIGKAARDAFAGKKAAEGGGE